MDLRGYESAKFEASEFLQRVVTHILTAENRSRHDRLQDLWARLAEDLFKQSAARLQLQTKEDQTASQRVTTFVAGRRNVNFAAGQTPGRSPAAGRTGAGIVEGIGHD